MKVFRHDDECVQEESSLAAVFEDGSLKELSVGRHLKKTATLRRYCGHEVGTSFLRCQSHLSSINEMPMAKAIPIAEGIQGPEGPCSLRCLLPLLPTCRFLIFRVNNRLCGSLEEQPRMLRCAQHDSALGFDWRLSPSLRNVAGFWRRRALAARSFGWPGSKLLYPSAIFRGWRAGEPVAEICQGLWTPRFGA